jgi:hypothetical protein
MEFWHQRSSGVTSRNNKIHLTSSLRRNNIEYFTTRCYYKIKQHYIIKVYYYLNKIKISLNCSKLPMLKLLIRLEISGKKMFNDVRFQVLTAASMKMTAFWYMAPCSVIKADRRFRGAYSLHHRPHVGSAPLKRRCTQRDYTALYSRMLSS